jgi:cytochrome c biogenesis protein CcdA
MSLLGSLVALAAIDSLNPTATAMQVYLLTTPKPIVRSVAFIAGIFLSSWTVGLLATFGFTRLIASALGALGWWMYFIQFVLGIALICVSYTLNTSANSNQSAKNQPRSLHPIRTFLLGMSVTLLEAPTALPYLAAIERLARAKLSLLNLAVTLGLYNLVFVVPLIGLLCIYITLQEKSAKLLRQVNQASVKWSPKVLQVLLSVIGTLLVADCIAFGLGRPFL